MTTFVDPVNVKVARAVAQQELILTRLAGESCGCHFTDDTTDLCPWHTVLDLLEPTITAFEPPL